MTHQTLLIELGTEELPPKALNDLAASFLEGMTTGLEKRGIAFNTQSAHALWSPRRLAVKIAGVAVQQPDQAIERRGPAVNAGLDASGAPSKALIGFAQSCGVEVNSLDKLETDKGAWFVHRASKKGEATQALVPELVREALKQLPIPKPMHWGDKDILFVRPVHWLVLLFGDQVIEGEVLGLKSDRFSRGHRFHHPKPVWIAHADQYIDALRAAHVIVDPGERRALIKSQIEDGARRIGGTPRVNEALLDEVNNLNEWPMPIACAFDEDFLQVPQEALITTMESNQKFFPVLDAGGRLSQHFIGIANLASKDENEIRKGYERVIRPRFADAKFFFDEDLKARLSDWQESLKRVTYQQKLGSVWDKCVRVAELSRIIAGRLGIDAAACTRAAALSKCDLMTRVVGEFPELQGVMGRTYASAQGEPAGIAIALDEFYAPRFAGDSIAQGQIGRVLAVAEKLDTLAGLFAVGQKPTGNKDPFSLRRNALGLARTLIEGGMDLDLGVLIHEALDYCRMAVESVHLRGESNSQIEIRRDVKSAYEQLNPNWKQESEAELYDFIIERLRGYYTDQGIRNEVFESVLVQRPTSLVNFDQRVRAVVEFARLPESQSLAAANKRIGNILRQAGEKQLAIAAHIDPNKLEAGAERALAEALAQARTDTQTHLRERRYVEALKRLAALQQPVDAFFEGVMVMVDDTAVRANRLGLLQQLRAEFLAIADVSQLQSV